MLRTMDLVHPLVVTRLILHWRTDALVAVTIVFLPVRRDETLLRGVRETRRGVLRPEPLLCRDRATSGRRRDHVAGIADADRHVADVHRDLAAVGVAECLRQRPDVVVREPQRLDLRQLRVLRIRRQSHPQAFQGVVQGVHSVPFAVVCLYPSVPLQPQHLFAEWANRNQNSVLQFSFLTPLVKNVCFTEITKINYHLDENSKSDMVD